MAVVFVLRAFQLSDALIVEKRLTSLPIRVGRNALADFQIPQRFVSDFHALIEDVGGRLYVRDLNSKNGINTQAENQSVPTRASSDTAIDLATCGFHFFLGVHVRVTVQFEHADALMSIRSSTVMGSVLGNQAILVDTGSQRPPPLGPIGAPPLGVPPLGVPPLGVPPLGVPPLGVFGPPPLGASPPMHAAFAPQGPRWDPNAPPPQQLAAPGGLPPLPPGMTQHGALPGALPTLPNPNFQSAAAPPGWSPQAPAQSLASTGLLQLTLDAMALQGLRELAGSLVPGQALNTTGDLARFITKLHDSIEVFCRCLIPLREGYTQFVSSLDLQKAAMQRSMMRSISYLAVENAREPAAVATALLDWRDKSMDAPKAIEGIFADLMIHQVALLDGVMQGVRALLEQLAPENIEEQTGPQGPFGLDRGKARYKALWETYCQRFEELAEEKQAFAHIFGPQFTDAYRDYRKQRQE